MNNDSIARRIIRIKHRFGPRLYHCRQVMFGLAENRKNTFKFHADMCMDYPWRDAGSGFPYEQTNQINFIRIKRQRSATRHCSAAPRTSMLRLYDDVMKPFIANNSAKSQLLFTLGNTFFTPKIHLTAITPRRVRRLLPFQSDTLTYKVLRALTLGNNRFRLLIENAYTNNFHPRNKWLNPKSLTKTKEWTELEFSIKIRSN